VTNNLKPDRTVNSGAKNKAPGAEIKVLAGAILLQALKDLWVDEERSKCIDFFSGQEFHICSKISGMSSDDKLKILSMVEGIIDQNPGKDKKVRAIRGTKADRAEIHELIR